MKERYLQHYIKKDLHKKIILVSGPRQSGKTTLAKMISSEYEYLNYDNSSHRLKIQDQSWDRSQKLLIFDEIHKMKLWKRFLKGIYDVEGLTPPIVVTGSSRMDTVKKTGDSLAGRYFQFRLHPFDVKEGSRLMKPGEALDRLISFGGFPEPFLENNQVFYNRWKKTHMDIILRHDLIDLESIRDIQTIEILIELLKERVGSPVSYASLARDLGKDQKTVKNWLTLLENLYLIFPVRPFHKNIARAILKEPKYYFYDTGQVKNEHSIRLENAVACSLIKELHFLEDTLGLDASLHYVRNKEGQEIDFSITIDKKVSHFIEVKSSDINLSKNFRLTSSFPDAKKIQLVKNIRDEHFFPSGEEIRECAPWLANLNLLEK